VALRRRRAHRRAPLVPYTTLFRSSGRAPTGATMVMELEIVGGYFANGSSAMSWSTPASATWTEFTGGGTVKRGGVLKLRAFIQRSEEHTSELQSREKLVCRRLHEK